MKNLDALKTPISINKTRGAINAALELIKTGNSPGLDGARQLARDNILLKSRAQKAEQKEVLLASIHANTQPAAIKKASKSAFKEARREAKSGAKKPGGQAKGTDERKRKALQTMCDLLDSGEAKSNREAARLAADLHPLLSIGWGRLNNLFSDPEAQKKIGFVRVRKMQKRKR